MQGKSTLNLDSLQSGANVCYRTERQYYLMSESQLNQYNGAYFDLIASHAMPKWIGVLGSISWPILTFTLPLVLVVTEYKQLWFIEPSSVEDIVTLLFIGALIACLLHVVARGYCRKSKKYTITRDRAISCGRKRAERYLRNRVRASEPSSNPLSFASYKAVNNDVA